MVKVIVPREQGEVLTREAWLEAAVEHFRPRFAEAGLPLPAKVHVSIGFGHGARAESKNILGQCWARRTSEDGINHIFLAPMHDDPARLLATLIHELVHAADDNQSGHRGTFRKIATILGLEGSMTATVPSAPLYAELVVLAKALGTFNHAALHVDGQVIIAGPGGEAPKPGEGKPSSGPRKQGTRMIKLEASCGYVVRTTKKWLREGLPVDPHGHLLNPPEGFVLDDPDDGEDE